MGSVEAQIADLLLDVENPRIAPAKSQRDALQRILDDQQEKLVSLAKSIVDEGTNPMDRLLVLRSGDDGAFVVLEGNRRVAALKILANPTILDGLVTKASVQRGFKKLASRFEAARVEPLDCYEVDDRQSGDTWLHLRHTGENGGSGVVGWSGLAASRFRGQAPALQALDLIAAHGGLSEDQKRLLEDRFPITTLDRLLSSREVRQRLGFDVQRGKLMSGLPPNELIKPLKRIVLDLAAGDINVSQLKNKKQQIEYVDGFDKSSRPDLSKASTVRPVEDIRASEFTPKPKPSPKKKRGADPSRRKTLIPRNARLTITSNRVASIFQELCQLKVDTAPNAIAVLFRVFLELSVDHYLEAQKMPLRSKDPKTGRDYDRTLKQKVQDAVTQLVTSGGNRKDYASVVRALSVEHSPLYIDLLNGYVHNRFTTPKSGDLMGSWDDAQRFFEGLWS